MPLLSELLNMFRTFVRLLLDFLPADELQQVLSEEAINRANTAADVAEVVKGLE